MCADLVLAALEAFGISVMVDFELHCSVTDWEYHAQTSMSGISVSDDAVNMYYFLKAKSTVCPHLPGIANCICGTLSS